MTSSLSSCSDVYRISRSSQVDLEVSRIVAMQFQYILYSQWFTTVVVDELVDRY